MLSRLWLPASFAFSFALCAQDAVESRPAPATGPANAAIRELVARLRSVEEDERACAVPVITNLGARALEPLGELIFALDLGKAPPQPTPSWFGFRRDARLDALRMPPESLLPADRVALGDDPGLHELDGALPREEAPDWNEAASLEAAAAVLLAIGEPALPLLGRMLADPARAHVAAGVLGRLGAGALPFAKKAVRASDPAVVAAGCRALGLLALALDDETLTVTVRCLQHDDARVRERAAWALVRLGAATVPALLAGLRTDDEEERARIAGVLALLGPDAHGATDALCALAAKSRSRAGQWALDALGRLQLDAGNAATVAALLTPHLEDRPSAFALTACEALGRLGHGAAAALPRLVELSASRHEDLRVVCTEALGGIGGEAARIALGARLGDPALRVRRVALPALARCGVVALGTLAEHFDGRDPATFDVAAAALVTLGEAGVPTLVARSGSENVHLRRAALLALGRLAAWSRGAAERIERAIGDGDDPARLTAIEAVAGYPIEHSAAALQKLLPLLRDESPYVRITAARTLGHFTAAARAAVPQLMDALGDEVIDVQIAATEALAAIGPDARAALTMLRQLAIDAPGPLQAAARTATRAIGASPGPRPR